MDKSEFLGFLHNADFGALFIECGWSNPTSKLPVKVAVGETEYTFAEAAQQKGFRVLVCRASKIPDSSVRRALDAKFRKLYESYLMVFVSASEPFRHLWSVPVKAVDKRQLVVIEYAQDDQATFLLEKLRAISFSFDDSPTIIDVVDRVKKAFLVNATEVTKKFYQAFRQEHKKFVEGILNISGKEDREWYASVMLNRLMFCYFIQKKGFLDNNENYLGDKLKWVKKTRGENKFDSFYRSFLKHLFQDGLDKPVSKRTAYFKKTYGQIPYLNGGMFAEHSIEKANKDIDIPDKTFERIFAFFDQWRWHLDTRISASGKDINPDVLGYIFEQYINDRAQMGAYYTKEDITEYIGRNCIVPWLLKEALGEQDINKASHLKDSGDRYIFPAVKKGVDMPLPPEIEKGVSVEPQATLRKRRAEWNKPAAEEYALPTEIWRETVARRQRCEEVRRKIASGEIANVNDFITFNLDIRAFAEDLIRKSSDHLLVRHFYAALRKVTILDPTCGSGAFLFAALNILEPLYEACLDRMEEFHEKNKNLFKEELEEVVGKYRSNRQYFIYKNIILRNLFGVDIMHEATEIARLRLFLKLVAVVDVDPYDENLGLDPLPDIDFNIRCGNTLVGFANPKGVKDAILPPDELALDQSAYDKVERKAKDVADLYEIFKREQQNAEGSPAYYAAKKDLGQRLAALNGELDRAMAQRLYGINPDTLRGNKEFLEWKRKTQPFHWYSEFYGITVAHAGFDVIIGNPPYVSMGKIDYLSNSDRFSCPDLYGHVIRRSLELLSSRGRHGFIVMHNIAFNKDFKDVRRLIQLRQRSLWCSYYARIPSGLFSVDSGEGARVRNCIYITSNVGGEQFTTRLHRWFTEYRPVLFEAIKYTSFEKGDVFPMFNSQLQAKALLSKKGKRVDELLGGNMIELCFRGSGYNWLTVTTSPAPCYDEHSKKIPVTNLKTICVPRQFYKALMLLFDGKIALSRWLTYGDEFNITLKPFMESRVCFDQMTTADTATINKLYDEFERRLPDTLQFKLNCGKRIGTYNISKLWDITDRSDAIFLKYLCDNPIEAQEAIEDHVTSCVISGRKDGSVDAD